MPAYNNYFPVGYQPATYQYQQPTVMQPQVTTGTQTSGIIWVQGEAGAKAYPVAPGNSLLLMDSESEQFYIKSTDVSGMPMPLRIFSYKEVAPQTENKGSTKEIDLSQFITKEEFESRLEALKMPLNRKIKKDEQENE